VTKLRYDSRLRFTCPDAAHVTDPATGVTLVRPPGAPFALPLPEPPFRVTHHDDGTVTVTPSIRWAGVRGAAPGSVAAYSYHGYLERGVWRSVEDIHAP
jgi:hypothetical protein